jgi:hypothetical protein
MTSPAASYILGECSTRFASTLPTGYAKTFTQTSALASMGAVADFLA